MIVSLVAIVGALILALRGLRSRTTTPRNWIVMGVAWLVIIVGVAFVIQKLGLEVAS